MANDEVRAPQAEAAGWRLERIPGLAVHHTQAGRLAIPLELTRHGESETHSALFVLTADEAQTLYDELRLLLNGAAADDVSAEQATGTGQLARHSRRAELFESLAIDGMPNVE
jgi:hypothetical protein